MNATFCAVSKNGEKYRLYVFADSSKRGLAKKITDFMSDQFDTTLRYFSKISGKKLTRQTPNLGEELRKCHSNTGLFTNLLAKLDSPLSHFEKADFEGSFEFFNGVSSLYVSFDNFVEGLPHFLDAADLFLFSQGLWDDLPKGFMQIDDEEKAFETVYRIVQSYNSSRPD